MKTVLIKRTCTHECDIKTLSTSKDVYDTKQWLEMDIHIHTKMAML